jgi:hypothetical protein
VSCATQAAFASSDEEMEGTCVGCCWRGDDGVKASSLIHGNGDRKLLCQVDVGICSK